jgi:phenylacetate-CoA ligase
LQRSAVRRLLLAGEAGAGIPSVRARIEAAWPGAAVRDHHGMTETGPVSFECPARQGWLHVREAAFIPEVLDTATLHAAPPDAVGELVLTGLGRIGSPLLRYRTGDLVRRGPVERCACGRYDLALPGGILGRADDMVVVRGVNLYPTAVDGVVRGCEGVEEYRVSVSRRGALTEVTLEVEAVAGYPDPRVLAAQVEARLRDAFHLRVPVTAVPCGALPRFELKARRWRRAGGDAAAGPAAGPGGETA